jgi:general secretion pathway protein L
MTGWEQLSHRAQTALDRLAWGLGDTKRILMERGAWPAAASPAVAGDGGRWAVIGARARPRANTRKAASFVVPESECLWGTLQLPEMPRQALPGGVQEALWRVSPMPPDQIVAAWWAEPQAQGGWTVEWGMCRRSSLAQQMEQHGVAPEAPVYLVRQGRAYPVRSTGWRKLENRQRWMDWAGAGLVLVVLAALALPAVMPLVLKRQAVVRAMVHVSTLEPQAAPLRHQMDDLRQKAQLAEELRKSASTDVPLASVMDALSVAIPADTWLDRIEVNGSEIRITGLTANATELIGQIGRQPGLADVRATGANVRDATLNKERFTLEMRWRGVGAKP